MVKLTMNAVIEKVTSYASENHTTYEFSFFDGMYNECKGYFELDNGKTFESKYIDIVIPIKFNDIGQLGYYSIQDSLANDRKVIVKDYVNEHYVNYIYIYGKNVR